KSNMDTAQKNLQRQNELFAAGAVSKAAVEQAENAYQTALSQYQSALEALNMQRNWTRPEDIASAEDAVRQAQEGVRSAQAQQQLDVILKDQVDLAQANVRSAQAA